MDDDINIFTSNSTTSKLFERIIESEEKYEKIFHNSPGMIAIIDKDGIVVEANSAMKKFLKIDPVGKSIFDLLTKDVAEKEYRYIIKAIKKNEKIVFENEKGGRYFINHLIPIELNHGRYCTIISSDVTEMKRLAKLFETLYKINSKLVRAVDKREVFDIVCSELPNLQIFSKVLAGDVEDDDFVILASSDKKLIGKKIKIYNNARCIEMCLSLERPVINDSWEGKICKNCIFSHPKRTCIIFPIKSSAFTNSVMMIHTENYIPEKEELNLLLTIAENMLFVIRSKEIEHERIRAIEEIRKNILAYSQMVDLIRNAVAVIKGLTELKDEMIKRFGEKRYFEIIEEKIKNVNDMLTEIDKRWEDSEKLLRRIESY